MYDSKKTVEQIKGISTERISPQYKQKWYEVRLPFHIDISLNIGSTMFDFCFWQLPEVLSIGIFWIHLDIQIGGRR